MHSLLAIVPTLALVSLFGFGIIKFFHKEKKDDNASFDHKPDEPRSVFLKPIAKDYDKKIGKYTRKR